MELPSIAMQDVLWLQIAVNNPVILVKSGEKGGELILYSSKVGGVRIERVEKWHE